LTYPTFKPRKGLNSDNPLEALLHASQSVVDSPDSVTIESINSLSMRETGTFFALTLQILSKVAFVPDKSPVMDPGIMIFYFSANTEMAYIAAHKVFPFNAGKTDLSHTDLKQSGRNVPYMF
jgi:hypothetical protein